MFLHNPVCSCCNWRALSWSHPGTPTAVGVPVSSNPFVCHFHITRWAKFCEIFGNQNMRMKSWLTHPAHGVQWCVEHAPSQSISTLSCCYPTTSGIQASSVRPNRTAFGRRLCDATLIRHYSCVNPSVTLLAAAESRHCSEVVILI